MALQNIGPVGDDAFNQGFLNAKFANLVISRLNRINKFNVVLPAGLGNGKIVDSEDGITLDLSLAKIYSPSNFDVWISGTLTTWAFNATRIA